MFQTNAPDFDEQPQRRMILPKVKKTYTLVLQFALEDGTFGTATADQWFSLGKITDAVNDSLPPNLSVGILALSGGHGAVIPTDRKPLDMRKASDMVARLDRNVIQEAVARPR